MIKPGLFHEEQWLKMTLELSDVFAEILLKHDVHAGDGHAWKTRHAAPDLRRAKGWYSHKKLTGRERCVCGICFLHLKMLFCKLQGTQAIVHDAVEVDESSSASVDRNGPARSTDRSPAGNLWAVLGSASASRFHLHQQDRKPCSSWWESCVGSLPLLCFVQLEYRECDCTVEVPIKYDFNTFVLILLSPWHFFVLKRKHCQCSRKILTISSVLLN